MPDGGYGPDFLSRSMFFREAEAGPSQQELATMTAPFGGSVEQARALYQSPEVQQRLQHFGLGGFNPDMIRQSPFLPNSLMQHHPMFGHMLSNAMANAAATPEAPLVSGAGSGISRAMQGMYGGPELQRQYQVRQLMAPFQALGMQLPIMAEQRRQELLQALEQDMKQRQQMEAGQIRPTEPRVQMGPYGREITEYQQGAPAGGKQGTDFQMQGPSGRSITPVSGPGVGQQMPVPQTGLTPEQQAGWTTRFEPYDPNLVQQITGAKETPAQQTLREAQAALASGKALDETTKAEWRQKLIEAGVPQATVDKLLSEAAKNKAAAAGGGKLGQGWTEKGASGLEKTKAAAIDKINTQFQTLLSKYGKLDKDSNMTSLDEERWKREDPGTYNEYFRQRQEIEDQYTEAGRALGGTYPGYEYSTRGQHTTVPKQNPFLAPGASTGSAQAGGAGSQKSEGTAMAPSTSGLPPGMVFDENGIPRLAPQQAQQPGPQQ